jgi:hypothetical protein
VPGSGPDLSAVLPDSDYPYALLVYVVNASALVQAFVDPLLYPVNESVTALDARQIAMLSLLISFYPCLIPLISCCSFLLPLLLATSHLIPPFLLSWLRSDLYSIPGSS